MTRQPGWAPRKPATKFPNLRKKIAKAKVQTPRRGNGTPPRKQDAR